MYIVSKLNQDGKMQRVSIETTIEEAKETCLALVRSGVTTKAVAYGTEFENRKHRVEVELNVSETYE